VKLNLVRVKTEGTSFHGDQKVALSGEKRRNHDKLKLD
jgi:hypothetical protein